jgi:hypothetical protein
MALDFQWRPALPVKPLAPEQFAAFPLSLPLEDLGLDAESPDDVVVDDHHLTAGDRPHGEFLSARNPQLADDEDIERRPQALRDLIRHRHATPGQAEDRDVVAVPVPLEQISQNSAGVPSVTKCST